VRFVHIDLTDVDSQKKAADHIEENTGFLDGLINNAGVCFDYAPPTTATLEALRTTFETNYFGTVMVTQTMLPLLRAGNGKVIVNVSTGIASMGLQGETSWPFHRVNLLAYNSSGQRAVELGSLVTAAVERVATSAPLSFVATMVDLRFIGQSTAPVGSTDEGQNGPDTGIARVEAAPCHRAQKQGNDFRWRPQLTNADMGADGTSQKARHQDRAENGGGRDGVQDGAGEYDRSHDTGQVHREPGLLH
jgi:hypothetical protein